MESSAGASVPPGWPSACSTVSVEIFVPSFRTQQFGNAPVLLLLCPCRCSECLYQRPVLRTWSQSATTAPTGSSSAPCPEVHSCNSYPVETTRRSSDRVKCSVCPHRAATTRRPDLAPHQMRQCSVFWCAAETAGVSTAGLLTRSDALIWSFWCSRWTSSEAHGSQ